MEFHIAHEKVIQSRKKYLIPIVLNNIHSKTIEDSDLRMYIESHTYLDSSDKVSSKSHECVKYGLYFVCGNHFCTSGKYEEETSLCHAKSSSPQTEVRTSPGRGC